MFSLLFLIICILLYFHFKRIYNYWKEKEFPYEKPKIPFGVLDDVRKRELSLGMAINKVYHNSNKRFIGIYLITRPALLIRDAQLCRDIVTTQFKSFHDRGIYVDEKNDPLSASLFALRGQDWKDLRLKLVPSFSSGKLKAMFGTIDDIANKMMNHLTNIVPQDGTQVAVEMKNLFSTYAADIIASVIFGLDVNSFENPNNNFQTVRKQLTDGSTLNVLRQTTSFLYPNLEKLFIKLGWQIPAVRSMYKIVKKTIEFRDKNNVTRKDMLQLLLQLRNTGKIEENDNWSAQTTKGDLVKHMSIEVITAQMLLFYVAGYDTTANTTSFTLYELSQYPHLLAKAQNDVQEAIKKHGCINYEAIQDMKFLDLCIMETVRKYPGLPILNRQCTEDFIIPGTDKVIEKGTPIIIPLYGIHHDEEYFPEPERYDPERYLEEKMRYNPIAYMPFGEGPRICIAQRMGKVNVKVALCKILTNFDIISTKEKSDIVFDNHGISFVPKGGINILLSRKM